MSSFGKALFNVAKTASNPNTLLYQAQLAGSKQKYLVKGDPINNLSHAKGEFTL